MGNKKTEIVFGIVIIAIGVLGILNQVFGMRFIGHIDGGALFCLGLGLFFEWLYFSEKKSVGVLVPGGLLSVVGLCDFLEAFCGGLIFGHFPAGEIGLALGLLQLYWFGKKNPWLLVPVAVLVFSAIEEMGNHFLGWYNSSLVWPIILIILGVLLLVSRVRNNEE